jgi:DinB family protein
MGELLSQTVVASWKQIVNRLDQRFAPLDDEQLQKQVAPNKNRLFYLLGHLTVVHDRMLPLLRIGERLHPQLDEVYLANPDRTLPDPLPAADLKKAWSEVNDAITSAVERFSPEDWLEKHTAVSDEDFAREPTRNRLAVFLSRTNHASFHAGQAVLAK